MCQEIVEPFVYIPIQRRIFQHLDRLHVLPNDDLRLGFKTWLKTKDKHEYRPTSIRIFTWKNRIQHRVIGSRTNDWSHLCRSLLSVDVAVPDVAQQDH